MAKLKNSTINSVESITWPTGGSSERPTSPVAGMVRFNTDYGVNETYNGTVWLANFIIGETGNVSPSSTIDDGIIETIQFSKEYKNPVVVAFIATQNGSNSVDCRVRNVTTTSCEIFMEEPDNASHSQEQVNYIIMEKGVHYTGFGNMYIEAGLHTTSNVHVSGDSFNGDTIQLSAPFSNAPAVLNKLNTYNNGAFMSSVCPSVSATSFTLQQEAASAGVTAVSETIGWIAFTKGVCPFYESDSYSDGSNDGDDDTAHTITFINSYFSNPDVVVSGVSGNGFDGYWVRGAGTYNTTTLTVYTTEDQVGDTERGHADEEIAYVATPINQRFMIHSLP